MKKILILLLAFCMMQKAHSQEQLTENKKLASLCKVWGFLKYYHPAVGTGNIEWDKELMDKISPVIAAKDKAELSSIYIKWIAGLGEVTPCSSCDKAIPDSFKKNLDLSWFDDKTIFTDSLTALLHYIQQNKKGHKNYYASKKFTKNTFKNGMFANEKEYKDSVFPSVNLRLVSLFRYWNIINYYFPYKYVIGEDWNNVLEELIPEFEFAKDTVSYHMAMKHITVKINDSHSQFYDTYTYQYYGRNIQPFAYTLIDNKAVVTGFYNDTLSALDDMQYGDVILAVDGKSIEQLINERLEYTSASNYPTKLRQLNWYGIFNGNTGDMKITYDRNGVVATKTVHRYFNRIHSPKESRTGKPALRVFADSIGYLDLAVLKEKKTKNVLHQLKQMNTRALIIDVRNYPDGTMYKICRYLYPARKRFVKFTSPDLRHPGVFIDKNFSLAGVQGKRKNKDYYKGKVIILFNEQTQSHGEFSCMAFQAAPNVTSIGSQTAGADGNVSQITFPGGTKCYMTGLGVYYPDGRPTQRIGIVPDIKVTPTIEGIRQKHDEVLERAITFANTGK